MKYQPIGKRNPGCPLKRLLDCYIETGARQQGQRPQEHVDDDDDDDVEEVSNIYCPCLFSLHQHLTGSARYSSVYAKEVKAGVC
jgi:hypothetical protein